MSIPATPRLDPPLQSEKKTTFNSPNMTTKLMTMTTLKTTMMTTTMTAMTLGTIKANTAKTTMAMTLITAMHVHSNSPTNQVHHKHPVNGRHTISPFSAFRKLYHFLTQPTPPKKEVAK